MIFYIVKIQSILKFKKLRTLDTCNPIPYVAILRSLVYTFQFCFYAYTNIYRFLCRKQKYPVLHFFLTYVEHPSMSIQIFPLKKRNTKLPHIRSTFLESSTKFHWIEYTAYSNNFSQLDIHFVSVLCYCKVQYIDGVRRHTDFFFILTQDTFFIALRERGRNIHVWETSVGFFLAATGWDHRHPGWDRTCNLGMCPDRNQTHNLLVMGRCSNQQSHMSQGNIQIFKALVLPTKNL